MLKPPWFASIVQIFAGPIWLSSLLLVATAETAPPNSTLNPAAIATLPPMALQKSPPIPPLQPLENLPASAATAGLQTLSLNGDWELTGTNPEGEKKIHVPGRVPGMVHPDLLRAGIIKDPFWRFQANDCQWVEDWDWTYTRDFTVPDGFPLDWVVLRFEGLDTYASIRINGREIGTSNDMFIPFEFEIGKALHPGGNHIEVAFSTVKKALEGKPYSTIHTLFDKTGERTYARKLACTFGWDWVNRFVSAGIWRPVTLTAYGAARIQDVFVATASLGSRGGLEAEVPATMHVELTTVLRGTKTVEAHWTLTAPDQSLVWSEQQTVQEGATEFDFHLSHPRLWWPNGAGSQPLYQLHVELTASEHGPVLDARTVETGIRTVAVEQKNDDTGRSFNVLINGTPIFCKGGNWVPADPFPSEISAAKYDLLIGQAKEAHTNILRCWGGGLYETPDFFHACARDGIMATQDFLLACSEYPDTDPDFLNLVNREFAIAVRALRNNPALITWAGGNELGAGNRPMQNWSGKNIQESIAGPLCRELDPTRPYFLTSPYGWDPNNSAFGGDRHTNAEMEGKSRDPGVTDYRYFVDSITGRYMSEYAASGSVPERVLMRFMTREDMSDPAMWEFHVKTNPYSGSKQTLFQVLEAVADRLYGKTAAGPGMYNKHLEQAEYDFVRWGMESSRRRKFTCGGILFWMYNDCWPAAGWSLLDYWGGPKAGWYGLKSGCQPVIVALEPGKEVFLWSVCNDKLEPVEATLRLRVQPWTGAPRWSKDITVNVPANALQVALEIPKSEILAQAGTDSVLVADLAYAGGTDRSWYFNGAPKDMALPPAHLEISDRKREGDHGSLTIHTDTYARAVTLDADADFSDNYFEMMPGETRTITWHALGEMPKGDIPVTCWNATAP